MDPEAVRKYAAHLLGVPGARVCCVVGPGGELLNEWVTTPERAARYAEQRGLARRGNVLVDSDGVVHRAWGTAA